MTQRVSFEEFDREVSAFQVRLQELRTQRILGAGGDEAAAAAFLELESAAEELRVAHEELWAAGNELERRSVPHDRDRDVLRVVFRDLPTAVILLDQSGRIRRVNQRAVDLLGVTADYLSGKPFPVFVDLPARAALRSHLAAVARGKDEQLISTSLLRQGRAVPVRLALSSVHVPADVRPVIMAVVLPAEMHSADPPPTAAAAAAAAHPKPWADRPQAVRAATRRVDLITGTARLLLGVDGGSEAVVLHAAATLLCSDFAEWVIVDRRREGRSTRASVCGPEDPTALPTLEALEYAAVDKAELPGAVIATGQSRLEAHIDDQSILGEDDRGVPFVVATGGHTVLCVAIEHNGHVMGAITALRGRNSDPFSLAEQATLEDVAALLGLAVGRDSRPAHSATGTRKPPVPVPSELDIGFYQRPANRNEPGADSDLDFYPSLDGWGVFLADAGVAGKQATDRLQMVRHWARLLGLTADEPDTLLTQLNWAMRRLGETDHSVAASAAHLRIGAERARVRLTSAGRRSSLILRSDGRVQRTDGGGQPLTGADAPQLHSADSDLERGDLLLLYNDALFDTRNSTGAGFGQSGQLRIALARAAGGTAQDVVGAVAAALGAFADGGLQREVLAAGLRFTGR